MKQIDISPGTEKSTYTTSGTIERPNTIWHTEELLGDGTYTIPNDEILDMIYSDPYPLQTTLTITTRRAANPNALIWAGQFIEAADSVGMKTEIVFLEDLR